MLNFRRRLISRLREAGHEAIHTLDLPLGNLTPDSVINELSIRERYVVITKDAVFVNSFAWETIQTAASLNRKHPKFRVGISIHVESGKHYG